MFTLFILKDCLNFHDFSELFKNLSYIHVFQDARLLDWIKDEQSWIYKLAVTIVFKQIQNKTLDSKHEQNNRYTVMRTDNELK